MKQVLMLDPVIGSLLMGSFVMLFASAASHKLRDVAQFADVLAGYGIPARLIRWRLARLVPALELLLAITLLQPALRAVAAASAAGVLLVYASAIAINLRAGRRLVACGCGGPDRQRLIAGWMVWRNVLLAAVAGLTMLPWNDRRLQWTDAVTIGFGLLAIALLYACADRLLGEMGRARAADVRAAGLPGAP
jgi:uncharacterized membrane protein YphA (DoxX/SURF4 family)